MTLTGGHLASSGKIPDDEFEEMKVKYCKLKVRILRLT